MLDILSIPPLKKQTNKQTNKQKQKAAEAKLGNEIANKVTKTVSSMTSSKSIAPKMPTQRDDASMETPRKNDTTQKTTTNQLVK